MQCVHFKYMKLCRLIDHRWNSIEQITFLGARGKDRETVMKMNDSSVMLQARMEEEK